MPIPKPLSVWAKLIRKFMFKANLIPDEATVKPPTSHNKGY